jgi:hypothetical protein
MFVQVNEFEGRDILTGCSPANREMAYKAFRRAIAGERQVM